MQVIETNLRFRGKLKRRARTDYIVLQHADASDCTVYDIHQWHLNRVESDGTRWAGIGYHFFADKAGRVYRGRPIDAVGAHCKDFNDCSVGICTEGDFEKEGMPAAQRQALLELATYLKQATRRPK